MPAPTGQASALVLATARKDTWGLVVNEAMRQKGCP